MVLGLKYHNPNSVIRLVWRAKEPKIRVGGEEICSLINTGAQVSLITQKYCTWRRIPIRPLIWLLNVVCSGGKLISYICHSMHLGATVSHYTKQEWEHPPWHLCSDWGYPLNIPTRQMHRHSCQKEHYVIRASCDDDWHHMVILWWCGVLRWWHLHQNWKSIKGRTHEKEGFKD